MSEFNDRPFTLGSLTGIRSFRVDHYGRLKASQFEVVWTPGEMVGRCLKGQGSSLSTITFYLTSDLTRPSAAPPPPPPPKEHRAGVKDCTCGFYAYFDNGPNSYHHGANVLGLIEGYGVTTVGTRGFRSEKARIQALIIKPKKASPLTARVRANYPDVPVFESKSAAIEAFPLTAPVGPTPDTDPEFWTREAL